MVACWPCKSDFSRLVGAKSWAYIFWSEQDLEERCKVWTHDCRLLLHYSTTFTQWNAFLETICALDFLMWLVSPKSGRLLITILHLTFIIVLHKYREEGVGKWKFLSIKLFTLKIKTSGLREKKILLIYWKPLLKGVKSQLHCFHHRHCLSIWQ